MKTLTILLFVCISLSGFAQKRIHNERYYQEAYNDTLHNRGHYSVMEVVLGDRTRVDILTFDYAIEVDFASKWAESVGQAYHYADKTNKRPMVVLIMEDFERDMKYLHRMIELAVYCNVRLVTIDSNLEIKVILE